MNTSGGPDVAGGYKVNANNSGLTKLFSYRQMATQLFGLSGDEYNGNIAFRQEFDISDDGSHLIFGTFSKQPAGHTIAVDGASLRILFEYAPASSGGLAISGDGKKVVLAANKFSGRTSIFSINFDGSNQIEIVEDTGQSPIFGGMTTDGSHVITQAGNLPITLLRTDVKGRLDLVASSSVKIQGVHPFFRAGIGPTISITPDGKRFCFPTIKEFGFSWQSQIWIADINPQSLDGAPSISDVSMSPDYVLVEGGDAATFKARPASNKTIESMTFDSFRDGVYKGFLNTAYLFDNGSNGDMTANDGLYTNNTVRSLGSIYAKDPGAYTVRFVAAVRQHITAVDVAPFFVLNQVPSGSPPVITSINPTSGEPGSQITINGTGFNPTANQNIVLIGNRMAVVISASPTQLVVEIPLGLSSGSYLVTVSTNGLTSNAVSITVGGGPGAFNPPRNLSASVSENTVTLNWNPPEAGSGTLQSYNIYRSTSPNAKNTGTRVGQVNAGTTQFIESELGQGIFYYQVTAVYDLGESNPSNEVSAQIGEVSGLNPPRNLTADIIDNFVLLFWEPPAIGNTTLAKQNTTTVDEVEPNNSPSQAQALTGPSPITVNGNAEVSDVGTIDDGSDDVEDLFRVTTTAEGLNINLSGFSSDCDLYLFDAYGSYLIDGAFEASATGSEEIDYYDLEPGTYVIGVSIVDFDPLGPDQTPYTLTITGQFGEVPDIANLLWYNIYRSTTPNARNTGTLIGHAEVFTTFYEDSNLTLHNFYYQVTAVYEEGESGPSNEATALIVGIEEGNSTNIPVDFSLKQNHPNPFNPTTTIKYAIPQTAHSRNVKLEVFNTLGEKVRTLVNNLHYPGYYSVQWGARDDFGLLVPSGVYIYRLQAGAFVEVRKMMLLR